MNCPYCGRAVADAATVCPNCGGPLTPVVLPEPETPPPAVPDQPVPGVPDSPAGPHGALPLESEAARLPGPGTGPPEEPPPVHRPPPPSAWSAPPGEAQPGVAASAWAGAPPAAPPPAPNRTPLIVGGLILVGVLLCVLVGAGLAALAFFTVTPSRTTFAPTRTPFALTFPSITVPTPNVADDTPPRMPLDTFKALYDDPDQRPLIIDVRSADTYNNGHIAGAISFPESDVDARVAELPKDKLIVAYCQ
jgi:hypothetical protein